MWCTVNKLTSTEAHHSIVPRTSLPCIRRRFQQAASSATFTYLSSTTLARKSRVLCHSIVTGLKSWMCFWKSRSTDMILLDNKSTTIEVFGEAPVDYQGFVKICHAIRAWTEGFNSMKLSDGGAAPSYPCKKDLLENRPASLVDGSFNVNRTDLLSILDDT